MLSMDRTFGAILVGGAVNAILYGVTSVQSYMYYVNYPKDVKRLKVLVGVIWALDTVHVALVTLCIYHYVITNFFEPLALMRIHWRGIFVTGFRGFKLTSVPYAHHLGRLPCVVLSHDAPYLTLLGYLGFIGHFGSTIYAISKAVRFGWILIPILVVLVMIHIAFGLETAVWLLVKPTFEEPANSDAIKLGTLIPMEIFAVLVDTLLAGSLCVLLHGSRTHISGTRTIINSLMAYAINRCLLTSFVTLTKLILFTAWPNEFWFLALDLIIGKLRANSLLASLNSRNHLRNQQEISVMNASLNLSGGGGGSAFNAPIGNLTINETQNARMDLVEEGVYAPQGNNVDVHRAWKSVATPEVQIRVPAYMKPV
ncbi:hypothetical protein V5O48_010037 [Marasmius crinis-equi]|uniref:DUF6534 domain-containing protein n=1 Tax=Marasmius crinis-equi TaxID=585013 RepID=A0ABR3F9F0_9AGAR